MHGLDPDLLNMPRSIENIPIDRPRATFYVLATAMLVLSVTVSDIITFELIMYWILIFKKKVNDVDDLDTN